MATYAHVASGEITRLGLPQTGTLSDGRQVSGYDRLDDRTLAEEGWLPVMEDRPNYDPERSTLTGPEYVVEASRVVARYSASTKAPALVTDTQSIIADGVSVAVVTYTDYGASAPFTVTFAANGTKASESLVNGKAQVEITTMFVGPVVVQCQGLSLTINATEATA